MRSIFDHVRHGIDGSGAVQHFEQGISGVQTFPGVSKVHQNQQETGDCAY